MTYALYATLAPLSLLANIAIMLTSPLWALIAAAFKLDKLPGKLALLHTHDDTIYGTRHRTTQGLPLPTGFWSRWKIATWWLCRNPGYGLDAYVFGLPYEDVAKIEVFGTDATGRRVAILMRDGRRRFGYRLFKPIGATHYLKVWVGWSHIPQAGAYMLKFDFHPYKRIKS